MKTAPLEKIFDIEYGNQLNFNVMDEDALGVNFVSRSRSNLGIVGRVARLPIVEAYSAGLITVSLGGSYLLSSFVQPKEFYTAQNIKVLSAKQEMSLREKVFYCFCISRNRFKYSSHGREANRSLNSLLVPSREYVPDWVEEIKLEALAIAPLQTPGDFDMKRGADGGAMELVPLEKIFALRNGINPPAEIREAEAIDGLFLPLVRPSKSQFSSFAEFVDRRTIDPKHVYPSGTLYISTNGQGSHSYAYVAPFEFVPNSDVTVALPRQAMSFAEKLFYAMVISKNRRLFSYGRKPKGRRLAELLVPASPPAYVYDKGIVSEILQSESVGL